MIRHTVMWKLGATDASERALAVAAVVKAHVSARACVDSAV